jgi:AcrR family transcriptional regulator
MAFDRQAALARMAAHVLDHGLQTATLRPLAAAAGTSDRMLIYHFGSRDALLGEVLGHLTADLGARLAAGLGTATSLGSTVFLSRVWAVASAPALRPYMRIWLELAAVASREQGARLDLARGIVDFFLGWVRARLVRPDDAELVLVLFEGLLVLQEAGQPDTVQAALARAALVLGAPPPDPDPE